MLDELDRRVTKLETASRDREVRRLLRDHGTLRKEAAAEARKAKPVPDEAKRLVAEHGSRKPLSEQAGKWFRPFGWADYEESLQ